MACHGALIEGNTIGPVGEEWVEERDGEDPERSPVGKPLADGLSLACKDSIVRGNVSGIPLKATARIERQVTDRMVSLVFSFYRPSSITPTRPSSSTAPPVLG